MQQRLPGRAPLLQAPTDRSPPVGRSPGLQARYEDGLLALNEGRGKVAFDLAIAAALPPTPRELPLDGKSRLALQRGANECSGGWARLGASGVKLSWWGGPGSPHWKQSTRAWPAAERGHSRVALGALPRRRWTVERSAGAVSPPRGCRGRGGERSLAPDRSRRPRGAGRRRPRRCGSAASRPRAPSSGEPGRS
jgi:hypothetical protein